MEHIIIMILLLIAKASLHNNNIYTTTKYEVIVPHDVHPGYEIVKLPSNHNQRTFELRPSEFGHLFRILNDGLLMSITNLTSLVNIPIHLVVIENCAQSIQKHNHLLNIRVRDKDFLRFSHRSNCDSVTSVQENLPIGQIISKFREISIARDLDNRLYSFRKITFKIAAINCQNGLDDSLTAFQLNRSNSSQFSRTSVTVAALDTVALSTGKSLDFEQCSDYEIVVSANDLINCSLRVVVDNVNDNRPVFETDSYVFVIEALPNQTVYRRFTTIGTVKAYDKDGDDISYQINKNTQFIIVPKTGEIMLIDDLEVSLV